ncbi:MAG: hypothetical protein Q7S37_04795 [bacterium]|nr:hypothetical protein [bacterium]
MRAELVRRMLGRQHIEKFGVLGYSSIQSRLVSLADLGIELSGEDFLRLKPEERPPSFQEARRHGFIVVDPPHTEADFQPNGMVGNVSLDLELGDTLKIAPLPGTDGYSDLPTDLVIDLNDKDSMRRAEGYLQTYHIDAGKRYVLRPGTFALAYTMRRYWLPCDLMGYVHGRSKTGRMGITVTRDAPKIDPGFCGRIVLELKHGGPFPLELKMGLKIGQMEFFTVEGEICAPYDELREDVVERQEYMHYALAPRVQMRELPKVVKRGLESLLYEVVEEEL